MNDNPCSTRFGIRNKYPVVGNNNWLPENLTTTPLFYTS